MKLSKKAIDFAVSCRDGDIIDGKPVQLELLARNIQMLIDEYEVRIAELEGRNKQQELSIISLAAKWKERDEALKASQQCITDFLDVYGRGCSMIVLDEAAKSLSNDALRLVKRSLINAI